MELSKEQPFLDFLQRHDVNICTQFCNLGIKSLSNVINPKLYISAASKLNEDPIKIEKTVQAIVSTLLKATENKLSSTDLRSILDRSISSKETSERLVETYDQNQNVLFNCLEQMSSKYPQYSNLEWRLDILAKTRSLDHLADPIISLDIETEESDQHKYKQLLQTDASTLMHVTASLEQALQQAHSNHIRKFKQTI